MFRPVIATSPTGSFTRTPYEMTLPTSNMNDTSETRERLNVQLQ